MTKKIKINSLSNPYFSYKDKDHLEQEFRNAKNKLAKQPSGTKIKNERSLGKDLHFSYSYIKIDQKIYALSDKKIDHRESCDIKAGMDEDGFLYAIKIEKKRIQNNNESEISIDLDLQEGLRTLRKTSKGYKRYAAQNFRGSLTLFEYLIETYEEPHTLKERLIERLTLARDLCAEVAAIHTGKAAASGRPYMHGDIKPDNITISEDDETINLIDFGTAIPMGSISSFKSLAGRTFAYLPYDDYGAKDEKEARSDMLRNMNLMDPQSIDLFAVLRTLFFPKHSQFSGHDYRSIFTQEVYNELPLAIQSLLETHFEGDKQEREALFTKKFRSFTEEHYTAKFFAAVFAHLLNSVKEDKLPLKLDDGWLKSLQNNTAKQEELLKDYIPSSSSPTDKKSYADFSPLYAAVKNNSAVEINTLLDRGHDPNQLMMDSNSMLMEAINRKKFDAALALLSAEGTNLNYQNDYGRTAFSYAVESENLAILKKLCEKQARLDLADIKGMTPLHEALLQRKMNVVPILIDYDMSLMRAILTGNNTIENQVVENNHKQANLVENLVAQQNPIPEKNAILEESLSKEDSQSLDSLMPDNPLYFQANISYPKLFLFPQLHRLKEKERQENSEVNEPPKVTS